MKVITSKIFKGKKMFLIDDENYQDGGSIIKAQKGLTTPKLLSTTKGIIIPTPNIDKFRTAYFTKGNPVIYDTKPDSNGKRYSFDNSITLHQNKFNGATVSKEMLTDLLDSADKIGIDRYKLLGLAGQESTLGHKNGSRFSQQGIVSGWTLDDHYDNYPKERFFADKKIPSTKVIKTNYGYDYDFDEKTVDNYLNNHPELITEYIKKLESIPKKPLEGINYFDEAAKNIKANEFNKYNPGDPDYTNKVNNSISFLKKDTVLSNFIKEYDLNKKTNSLKLNQQEIDKIIKQQEKKPIKVTSVGNIKPGGLIESQFQDGGVIEDNQGQWKYPGQITKINSNNITMKGVPYPVYGVSDIGDKQMMYPNGEYKFKGNSVTEYPILAQAGTTVKINKDNIIKKYDIRSPEYKQMYDSGNLMSYDKTTDTYTATPLQTQVVKTNAPQWLLDKRKIEQNYTKEKFVKKSLPKWANSVGETADNLSENAQKDYEKKVNDKLANIILKRNPKLGKSTEDRLKWAESLTEKERDIVNRSSYANKFLPAMNAYNENQSNLTKNYSTRALLSDADKLAQSVEGTPERFRLFPNAENNIESYVNPGMFLGSMAKGLGNVPKDIKNENYGQAALSIAIPLGVGALAGIGNPSTGQFVNNLTNPFAGTGDLAKGIYNKGITALERNSIRKSIVPELKQVSKTNGISNQLPTPPQEIYFDINTQIPNREVINLNRNRISDLPPAPFVTDSEFQHPITNLMDALNLSDSEFTRLQNTYRTNPNYFNENNINATESALNNFISATNPRMFENNFLNINNNTNISDLINNRALTERLDFNLKDYKNLTYDELVLKNPTLAEKLKNTLNNLKTQTVKFGKELDLHAGKIINPKQNVNRVELENSINNLLDKGLGIKQTDLPIKVKSEGNQLKIFIDQEKNGNFLESGYISIPEEGLDQKTLTQTLLNMFKNKHVGVQKTLDYPTTNVVSSSLFKSGLNTKGIGAEVGEAIKQSLKLQNKNWNLLSSQSHTNEGAARYLTEFLNGRKTPIDISANPEWLKEAEKIKKLYPKGIKKEEVIELMKKNPDLRPTNIKFKYPYGGTIKVLNTKVVNGQKQYLIENDSFIPSYANGGSIAELYTEKTGKDWSTAKTTGLTTGSYADNIKLKQRLLNGEFNFSPDFSSKLNKVISFTHKTFNEAFKVARQQLGANQIFEFQGKKYGTNLKGEKFEPTKEVLENAGMNTPLIKQNLYEQNKLVNSVYSLKKTVKLEPEYKDWEDVKKRQEEINKMDQSDIIKKYYKGSDEQYLIVDKARGKMHLMKGDKEIASYNVGTGENFGDEQTRTWVDKETKKTDWSKGNKQTGAGIYTVSNKTSKNPHYSNVPSWNFKNEYGIEVPMAIHAALQNRVSKINDKDETNNRVSNGCINGLCYDLEDLYTKGLKEGQKLYILPDDPNNKYEISNGKLVFKANSPNVNKSVNTLNYKPIKIEYAKSLKTDAPEAVEMAQSIVNNKQKLMKDLKINGDIYNELAKLTLGLAGQESKYGTSIKFKLKTEATQDLLKSITGNNSFNSKGLTQIKFDGVNEEVKKIFNKYGITKYNLNSGDKAALAQMILLSHMYNNELPAYRKYTKEKNISDMDALLYLNQGKRDELINKTATPDKNIYIQNVKKFANDFKIKQLN